ncbi:hypothetical protein CAT7_00460 [Carnobacterium sp. AT7]|uniref:competence protein ComK n=2 Tax=Carnobacteriaceae TaxID=186828 RepID=UPI00015F286C|nr:MULTISPECIES: competence protein ComK [Carnobacterium]EDP67375.1 hypothetical protein CAT7_00460 [Carnobacterium sp. AT7]
MKDSFSQNKPLFNKMKLDCELESILCIFLEELNYQKENHLQEECYDEEEYIHTSVTSTADKISSTTYTIDEWLKRSIEQNQILLNYQTFYVMDISHHSSTPFNTIVFQSNLYPLKTKETSKDLMKRFIDHKGIPYEKIRSSSQLLGFYYKIPYVLGELVFIPEKSSLKGTSSWFALHHVSQYELIEQSNKVRLHFKNQSINSVVTEQRRFLKQVEKGAVLSFCQQLFAKEMLLTHYNLQTVQYRNHLEESHFKGILIPNQIDHLTLERYVFFIQNMCNELKIAIRKQSLTVLLGDDHPNLNDILLTFMNEAND